MNDLSGAAQRNEHCSACKPIPTLALCILVTVLALGFSVAIFILVVIHNAFFFLYLLFLSGITLSFLLWNSYNWARRGTILGFLQSFPESDLRFAREGELVKITGITSCGNTPLESSYEKATRCIYVSTTLYEYKGFSLKHLKDNTSCLRWNLAHCERFSTDFFITDRRSGLRAMVKAGSGSRVVPLISESKLINTTRQCRALSPSLLKWLRERNLSLEARVLRLEEGYVQEGSSVSVIGTLRRANGLVMIVQPPDTISTGCLWQKLLLPVDIDGLILAASRADG